MMNFASMSLNGENKRDGRNKNNNGGKRNQNKKRRDGRNKNNNNKNVPKESLYKTELCRQYAISGQCSYGPRCQVRFYFSLSLFTNIHTPINKYSSHTERAIFEDARFVIRNTRPKDARRTGIKDSALTEVDVCSFMMKVQTRLRLSRPEISQERLLEI